MTILQNKKQFIKTHPISDYWNNFNTNDYFIECVEPFVAKFNENNIDTSDLNSLITEWKKK